MISISQFAIALQFALLLQLVGVSFGVMRDPYIKDGDRKLLIACIVMSLILIVQNRMDYSLGGVPDKVFQQTLAAVIGYWLRPIIIACFIQIVKEERWAWILCIVNVGIYFLSFGTRLVIWFSENGHFSRGPLGYTCHIVSFILLIWLFLKILERYRGQGGLAVVYPAAILTAILLATAADTFFSFDLPITFLTIAIVSSCVFFFIWLHQMFVYEHEKDLLTEQRIRIMISQIQPHFLFNTLSTIQSLCLIDPNKASETVSKFGTYLRQNIDSLNQEDLILFEAELEHTKVYADIEMLRFPNIKVEYDIRETHFSVPALSLQPIVENSIRHGVRGKRDGRVYVSTRQEAGFNVIRVTDNGKGFDVIAAFQSDHTHIGLRNVKERIEKMCGGTMLVKSTLGEGTEVTIRIPAGKENA